MCGGLVSWSHGGGGGVGAGGCLPSIGVGLVSGMVSAGWVDLGQKLSNGIVGCIQVSVSTCIHVSLSMSVYSCIHTHPHTCICIHYHFLFLSDTYFYSLSQLSVASCFVLLSIYITYLLVYVVKNESV